MEWQPLLKGSPPFNEEKQAEPGGRHMKTLLALEDRCGGSPSPRFSNGVELRVLQVSISLDHLL